MSDFEITKLKRDLSELSEKLETTKNEKMEQARKFFEVLSHSDLMVIRDQLNDVDKQPTERMTLIDKCLTDYLEDKITLIEAKNLLAGNEIEKRPKNKIDKIFNEFGQYHLWAKEEKIRQFFTRIKFSEEDIILLSDFPANRDHPRIVEILFNFGEYFDEVSDLAQAEANLYPDRFKEVKKTVHYRGDIARFIDKKEEEITELERIETPQPEPQISNVENQATPYVECQWIGKGADGGIRIRDYQGELRQVFRGKTYRLSYERFLFAQKQKRPEWRKV